MPPFAAMVVAVVVVAATCGITGFFADSRDRLANAASAFWLGCTIASTTLFILDVIVVITERTS